MSKTVLLTGPTGYVGARLAPRLIEKGYKLKCLVRNPAEIETRSWSKSAEIIKGDVYCGLNLKNALEGTDIAYYLVHSMADTRDFEKYEEVSAFNFASAAAEAGVKKIIYLGGLAKKDEELSRHLKSRIKTGEILRSHFLNVIELRAGIIVGSGSVSFEMIRYLSERLPFVPHFRYLKKSKCQPIAIRDVLSYLLLSAEKENLSDKIIEIGGPDCLKYYEMLDIYAKVRGLKRFHLPCPSPSPKLCGTMISIFTPIPYNISVSLLESLKNDSVKSNDDALKIFPEVKPLDYETAVKYALQRISEDKVESSWTANYAPSYHKPCSFIDAQGIILQDYNAQVNAENEKVYRVFSGIGGENGYYFANWVWKLKAFQDKLIGGIGMRNGRRSLSEIHQGETLDFWRVERIIPSRMMLLRAEMKLPGKGWLQFQANKISGNKTLLRITAYFEPKGVFGYLYWYLLYPIHTFIFKGLIKEIKKRSENL
ncbi:MAG: SDR family oxidoreductase [Elusimicrobia bacterium]|nr:SDR family oxidoreductase [Elusimicrobiota bacterium]